MHVYMERNRDRGRDLEQMDVAQLIKHPAETRSSCVINTYIPQGHLVNSAITRYKPDMYYYQR